MRSGLGGGGASGGTPRPPGEPSTPWRSEVEGQLRMLLAVPTRLSTGLPTVLLIALVLGDAESEPWSEPPIVWCGCRRRRFRFGDPCGEPASIERPIARTRPDAARRRSAPPPSAIPGGVGGRDELARLSERLRDRVLLGEMDGRTDAPRCSGGGGGDSRSSVWSAWG